MMKKFSIPIEELKYKWMEKLFLPCIFIFHSNQIFIVFNIKILLIDLFFNLFLKIRQNFMNLFFFPSFSFFFFFTVPIKIDGGDAFSEIIF